jgi:hypothetical protein
MRITATRSVVCSPGRDFVTVAVETDRGSRGVGEVFDEQRASDLPYLPAVRRRHATVHRW